MACLKLKAWEVSQFGKKDVECKPDRNRPADLTLSKPGTHKMDSKKGPQAIVNIYRTPNLFPITGLFVFFLH